MSVKLTPALRAEYTRLFDTCEIRTGKLADVEDLAVKINNNRPRYERVAAALGSTPWYFVGAVHCMEASLNFRKHLHNGDPLSARTVQVPAGRPLNGNPPFEWEVSADDALRLKNLHEVTDWSVPALLFRLEGYNGWGYRRFHPDVLTPYLWSFSRHYTMGKYVADGTFDPEAVSKQCGCAVILRRMAEKGMISLGAPEDKPDDLPLVTYSETEESEEARKLQRALNEMPGIFLLVDGVPGKRTSDAFRRVTGSFLKGDPRAEA